MSDFLSQALVEIGYQPDQALRVEQALAEVGYLPDQKMRVSQVLLEVAWSLPPPNILLSQFLVEVAFIRSGHKYKAQFI